MSDMPAQATLEGFELPAAPTDRLFFAIFPDAETIERIDRLRRDLRSKLNLRGRLHDPSRLHITLHHLGDHPGLREDIVSDARAVAETLQSSAFPVELDRVMSFSRKPRNRPFVLRGSSGLTDLVAFQQALGAAMKKTSLRRWVEQSFTPHVTLLYDDAEVPEQSVDPIRWTVGDFALVHSLLRQTRHEVLGRWPLGA